MNYMWEAFLKGGEQGLDKGTLRFTPSSIANPYREVFFKDINKPNISAASIEVNAYYRYSAVFEALLGEDMDGMPEFREVFFDILAHYLSGLDLRSGMCRGEYYMKFLSEDLAAGVFGQKRTDVLWQKARESLNCFDRKAKRLVLAGLLRMYKIGASMSLLAQLLRTLYPDSIVYLDVRDVREVLIYTGMKQTEELSGQMELLCYLFVPADYSVKLFWDRHFGLMGIPETMEIGEIMMYE